MDRDADVGQLARVVKAAFGLSRCGRHEFTDTRDPHLPTDACLAEVSEDEMYERARYLRKQWPSPRPGRRWGDRWTMIDSRDPRTTFEWTVAVPDLFRPQHAWATPPVPTVFFRCDSVEPYSKWRAGQPWWLRLELVGDDIDAVSAPAARLVRGSGAAPFDGGLGAHRFATVLAEWRNPRSPGHPDARALVARTVGPWTAFDPDAFDLAGTQADVAAALDEGGPLPAGTRRLLESVPATVQPGLRRHLAVHGIGLGPVITTRQAEQAVAVVRRALTEVIGADGREFDEAEIEMSGLVGNADAGPAVLERLRRLRLIYRRNGSWRVKRDVLEAASDPLALWDRLARAAMQELDGDARFLLLAIADGTIADEDAALETIAAIRRADGHVEDQWGIPLGLGIASTAPPDRARLDELRSILMLLLPEPERDGDLAASETLREFARTCLQ